MPVTLKGPLVGWKALEPKTKVMVGNCFSYPLKQCAAVRTVAFPTRVPVQCMFPSIIKAPTDGNAIVELCLPPTMKGTSFEAELNIGAFKTSRSTRALARLVASQQLPSFDATTGSSRVTK